MADMYYSKVFFDRLSGEYFIPASAGPPYFSWREVTLNRQRSSPDDTFMVFDEGCVRDDLDGRLYSGSFLGTHTIIPRGSRPSPAEIERFRTSYRGVGCLLFLLAIPAAAIAAGALLSRFT